MADAAEHFKLGVDAFKRGDCDTAIQELEAATQLDRSNHKAFTYLGAAYAAQKRFDAAVGAFKIAEQLAPNVASIHYNIGQAYESDGIPSEAEFEYERALEIDPNYANAQEALDRIKKKLHHI